MSAGKLNLEIEKKATFSRNITVYSTYIGPGSAGNVPMDITGCAITAVIKKNKTDASIVIAFTGTVLNGPTGVFNLSLTAAQTSSIAIELGVYDVLLAFSNGFVERLIEGQVVVTRGVS